jgi:hypothetical protein
VFERRPIVPDLCAGWSFGVPNNRREIVLLTNLFGFGSTTVAAIYKEP